MDITLYVFNEGPRFFLDRVPPPPPPPPRLACDTEAGGWCGPSTSSTVGANPTVFPPEDGEDGDDKVALDALPVIPIYLFYSIARLRRGGGFRERVGQPRLQLRKIQEKKHPLLVGYDDLNLFHAGMLISLELGTRYMRCAVSQHCVQSPQQGIVTLPSPPIYRAALEGGWL